MMKNFVPAVLVFAMAVIALALPLGAVMSWGLKGVGVHLTVLGCWPLAMGALVIYSLLMLTYRHRQDNKL